jgi:hypothetical protein
VRQPSLKRSSPNVLVQPKKPFHDSNAATMLLGDAPFVSSQRR